MYFFLLGKLIIDEPIEALLARADKFIINKEVLDRLQESFASEILSIALIRSQILFNEQDTDTSGKNSPTPVSVGVRTTFANAIQNHFRPYITTNTSSSSAVSATITNSASSITSTGSNDTTTTGLSLQHPNTTTNPTTTTTTTTTISVVNTGLASLSSTERRKVILEQQRKEAEIEEQLLSGAEAPVFWLLRYGTKLPDKVLQVGGHCSTCTTLSFLLFVVYIYTYLKVCVCVYSIYMSLLYISYVYN